ncbi:MAG: hypothetical protein HKN87_17230 [Saprospiraceae bacterium]|nr:hypothetical protein [Saprospiraceae bacterium]
MSNALVSGRIGYIRPDQLDRLTSRMSQTLKLYIPSILSENKIVLLKGIGALKINYRSAQFDGDLSIMSAPREEIFFVPSDEEHLDPILVKIVELIAKVDESEASNLVQSFMQDLKTELRGNGFLTFPNIGWIKQDNWGSLFFEPAAEYIAINRYFGLGQVALPPALSDAEQEVLADLKETVSEKTARAKLLQSRPSQRTWGFIISAILVLLTVFSVLYFSSKPEIPLAEQQVDTPTTQPAADLPAKKLNESPPSNLLSNDSVIKEDHKLNLPNADDQSKVRDFREEDLAIQTAGTCIVVVGAFADEGNVDRMVQRLEDSAYESVIIEGARLKKVGLRVQCDGDSGTLDWARKHIDQGAWLYKGDL